MAEVRASFHSTDCPSEWGQAAEAAKAKVLKDVSIQLIAPASGASRRRDSIPNFFTVSIQLIAPASGAEGCTYDLELEALFPFN